MQREPQSLLPLAAASDQRDVDGTQGETPIPLSTSDTIRIDSRNTAKQQTVVHEPGSSRSDEINQDTAAYSNLPMPFEFPAPFEVEGVDQFLCEAALVPDTALRTRDDLDFDLSFTQQTLPIESDLTYKIIIGQLKSYPQRMLDGSLPPFIFPECKNDKYLCVGSKGHHCLPAALARCRAVVAMFETMTVSNSDFLWETVCNEADRLRLQASQVFIRLHQPTC